jgi:hypothetical protein
MRLDHRIGLARMPRCALTLLGALGVLLLAVTSVGAATATGPGARLVYLTRSANHPTGAVWDADVNGSNPVRLASGALQAMISPDGASVALLDADPSGSGASLDIVPSLARVPFGAPAGTVSSVRRLVHAKQVFDLLAWSPDSRKLAVLTDGGLTVVDASSAAKHLVARGDISAATFSPSSDRVLYSSFGLPNPGGACSNVFVVNADGSGRHALTHDGLNDYPVWGPHQIAFARSPGCIGPLPPASQIWLMNPDGSGAHQLTHQRFAARSPGLTPVAWSDDGSRLLAERIAIVAARSSAWAVEIPSGRARDLGPRSQNVNGVGLSHDGNTVLAVLGLVHAPSHETIATIPWQGGRPHVLARHADTPSWTR